MKKIFLLITIVVYTIGLSTAQTQKGFEKGVEAGLYAETEDNPIVSFTGSFIAGYRFNPFVFVGGGGGLDLSTWDGGSENTISVLMPMFARGKFNFTKTKISPFAFIDTGYNIFLASNLGSDYKPYVREGVFFRSGVGVDFNRQNGKAISISMSFRSHSITSNNRDYNIDTYGFNVMFKF